MAIRKITTSPLINSRSSIGYQISPSKFHPPAAPARSSGGTADSATSIQLFEPKKRVASSDFRSFRDETHRNAAAICPAVFFGTRRWREKTKVFRAALPVPTPVSDQQIPSLMGQRRVPDFVIEEPRGPMSAAVFRRALPDKNGHRRF